MNINWVPDAIPLSLSSFLLVWLDLLHPFNLFQSKNKTNKNSSKIKVVDSNSYKTIYGFSCRSLFEILLKSIEKEGKQFGITPIHHTSWRDLIQKYIQPEQITIIDLDIRMSHLDLTKLSDTELEQIDVVIVTHMFGLDFDLTHIEDLKNKYNWLVIEDRVQGGTVDNAFSHPIVDVAFYSMGMDKRPCSLGGGFVNIKNENKDIQNRMIQYLEELPEETWLDRLKDLGKKTPTYCLYSYQSVYRFAKSVLPWFSMDLSTAVQKYRKNNPGFAHDKYLVRPSPYLLSSMDRNKVNYIEIEKRMRRKFSFFYRFLKLEYIPWVNYDRIKDKSTRDGISLTMYNTIFLQPEIIHKKMEDFKKYNIAYLPNPTWKVLQVAPPRYQDFCNGLVYLPCLYHMNEFEMQYLSSIVNSS